jgi:hypothetical protein
MYLELYKIIYVFSKLEQITKAGKTIDAVIDNKIRVKYAV